MKRDQFGNKNPFFKHNILRDYFKNINSKEKAYILGFVAGDGNVNLRQGRLRIELNIRDIDVLRKIKSEIDPENSVGLVKNILKNTVSLSFFSKELCEDFYKHMKIPFTESKKSKIIKFPDIEDKFVLDFIRGFFDADGSICHPSKNKTKYPICTISSTSDGFLEEMSKKISIPHFRSGYQITFKNLNCLDFLGSLYDNPSIYLSRKRDLFFDWCVWSPSFSGKGNYGKFDGIKYSKCRGGAVPPSKNNITDSGYDLTIIEEVKRFGAAILYGTGIKITPPFGYYFDMIPRSSISKTGYILANNIGVIDRQYKGEIFVPLIKLDKNAKDLELPCKIVQIIPRRICHFDIQEISEEELEKSSRGEGGFGSSGI